MIRLTSVRIPGTGIRLHRRGVSFSVLGIFRFFAGSRRRRTRR